MDRSRNLTNASSSKNISDYCCDDTESKQSGSGLAEGLINAMMETVLKGSDYKEVKPP